MSKFINNFNCFIGILMKIKKNLKKDLILILALKKIRCDNVLITKTLQLYHTEMSIRDISNCFEQENIEDGLCSL